MNSLNILLLPSHIVPENASSSSLTHPIIPFFLIPSASPENSPTAAVTRKFPINGIIPIWRGPIFQAIAQALSGKGKNEVARHPRLFLGYIQMYVRHKRPDIRPMEWRMGKWSECSRESWLPPWAAWRNVREMHFEEKSCMFDKNNNSNYNFFFRGYLYQNWIF